MSQCREKNNTLHLNDCVKVMQSMDSKSVDIVITSPPYNLNIKYGKYKDDSSRKNYLRWLNSVFFEIDRVLKDNGSFFLNMGSSNTDPWVCYEVAFDAKKYFALQNDITWVKSISIKDESYGHYKPINSERFLNHTHEKIWHFTKNNTVKLNRTSIGVPYQDKSNIKRWGIKDDLRCRGNCWFIPYDTIVNKSQKGKHPAVFPSGLAENCIRLHGFDKDTVVLEPFLGSGSTLIACKRLGVNGVGCEIDSDYFAFALDRIQKEDLPAI